MRKGIVLFDIKDFLYQGSKGRDTTVEGINKSQSEVLELIHTKMRHERQRRTSSSIPVPAVDLFLPTGDGYYLLCPPKLTDILDIAICIMGMLQSDNIQAYFVAHVGDMNIFTDMTGRENATGFALGYASRLQSLSREPGKLVCSEDIRTIWDDNQYFELEDGSKSGIAKDEIEYGWKLATPKDFESVCAKFESRF